VQGLGGGGEWKSLGWTGPRGGFERGRRAARRVWLGRGVGLRCGGQVRLVYVFLACVCTCICAWDGPRAGLPVPTSHPGSPLRLPPQRSEHFGKLRDRLAKIRAYWCDRGGQAPTPPTQSAPAPAPGFNGALRQRWAAPALPLGAGPRPARPPTLCAAASAAPTQDRLIRPRPRPIPPHNDTATTINPPPHTPPGAPPCCTRWAISPSRGGRRRADGPRARTALESTASGGALAGRSVDEAGPGGRPGRAE
jgi:hypothetical protein